MAKSSLKQLWTNATWLLLGRVFVQALGFALSFLLARQLGPSDFGEVSLILSVVFVGNVVTTFGLDTLLLREVAIRPDTPLLGTVLRAQLMLSLIFILSLAVIVAVFDLSVWMLVYSLSLFPLAFTTVYSAILRANERMDRYLIGTVFVALIQVMGVIAFGRHVQAVIVWLLFTQILSVIIMAILTQTRIDFSGGGAVWGALKGSVWLVSLMALSVILQRWGIFALSILGNNDEVGLFAAALRFTDVFRVVPYVVFGALFPSMARSKDSDIPSYLVFTLVISASLGALLLSVSAPLLIRLVYGEAYHQAIGILRILVWIIPLYILTGLFDLQFVSAQQEKRAAMSAGFGLVGAMIITLVAFPLLGINGIGLSVLLGETIRVGILRYNKRVIH